MFGNKIANGSIMSFFKPKAQEPSKKRPLEEESHKDAQPRSKSPKTNTTPLAIRTDSPNAKRVGPPLAFVPPPPSHAESSELSSIQTPSEADDEDTIVLETREPIVVVPRESFRSTQSSSSSRRENKYGQVFVAGSSEDDSDDLLDMDQLLGKTRAMPKPVEHKPPALSTRKALSMPKKKKYVSTVAEDEAEFMKTLNLAKKDSVKQERASEALAKALAVEDQKPSIKPGSSPPKPLVTTNDILARVGDRAPQVAEAMERIEMQQVTRQWFFFSARSCKIGRREDVKNSSESKTSTNNAAEDSTQWQTSRPFPRSQLSPEWRIYQEDTLRELALTGGVFIQAAIDHQMPDGLYLWILDEAFTEKRVELREACQSLLHYAGFYVNGEQCLTILEAKLRALGCKAEALSLTDNIRPAPEESADVPSLNASRIELQTWLRNTSILAQSLSAAENGRILEWLLTMTLDSSIAIDAMILKESRIAIAVCLARIQENDARDEVVRNCLKHIYHKASDVHFRLQCIRSMPATSRHLSRTRRRLALASFYGDDSYIGHDEMSPTFLENIQSTLSRDLDFHPSRKTDYRKLAARLACLDIAIGNGNRPESNDPAILDGFDATVDDLAKEIKTKFAKIQATGAAHISRTETKDILEAIEKRLRLTVRTRPQKKKNVYEQSTITDTFKKPRRVA